VIGVRSFPVQQVIDDGTGKSALEEKAARYGTLDHTCVVAVNALGIRAREPNAVDALPGTPCMVVRHLEDGGTTCKEGRNTDGVRLGPTGGRRKGLSALLSTERIDPWNSAFRHGRPIRFPEATAPLPHVALGIDDYELDDGGFRLTHGQTVGEVLGLPEGWPETRALIRGKTSGVRKVDRGQLPRRSLSRNGWR
jgi:hypothetical protein